MRHQVEGCLDLHCMCISSSCTIFCCLHLEGDISKKIYAISCILQFSCAQNVHAILRYSDCLGA